MKCYLLQEINDFGDIAINLFCSCSKNLIDAKYKEIQDQNDLMIKIRKEQIQYHPNFYKSGGIDNQARVKYNQFLSIKYNIPVEQLDYIEWPDNLKIVEVELLE